VTPTIIVLLVAIFASVAALVASTMSYVLTSTSTERKRLKDATRTSTAASVLPAIMSLAPKTGGWQEIEAILPRSKKEMDRLRGRLHRAGFRYQGAPTLYTLTEFLGPVALGGIAYYFMQGQGQMTWIVVAGAVILGFFVPGLYLEQRLTKYRRQLQNGLPDALDLMVVCIEAGSGLDQAIVKTSDELAIAYPILAEELRMVITEVRAGKPRLDAFKSLANRTKVDDIRSLVAMLLQTDKFGTSVGQALRTHADTSRTKRRQRAEERAQKIGVKLVFPLVLFFFPALYVVVLGPAVIQLMHAFISK